MIKIIRQVILGGYILLGFSSCVPNFNDIHITNVEKPSLAKLMDTQGDLELNLEIQNSEARDFTIQALELRALNQKGNILVTVHLKNALIILKKAKQYYRVPVDLTIDDPLGCFFAYNSVRKGNEVILIEGSAKVKYGWFTKTISINRNLGTEINQLIQFK